MARAKGNLPFSGTFEVQAAQPFDARMNVGLKTDLTNLETWKALDNSDYVYPGLITVVSGDTEENNGIYRLKQKPITDINNWVKEGGSSIGGVSSVNTKTGDVVLTTADIQSATGKNIDTLLTEKQNSLTETQITNIDNIDNKADTTYVDEELNTKQDALTTEQITNIDNISNKADITYVDEELALKQDILTPEQITNINAVPNKQNTLTTGDNITIVNNVISATGVLTENNYVDAINKPTLNGIEIDGDKSSSDYNINIPDVSNFVTRDDLNTKQDLLTNAQITNINAVPNKANTDYVNTELSKKQNNLTAEQLANIENIENKADKTYVDTNLGLKQNSLSTNELNNIADIPNKANTIYVDEQLTNKQDTLIAGANITIDQETNTISSSGGSGGTSDYTALTSKPQINGVELNGNKTTEEIGITIPTNTSDLTNDSNFVVDANYVHTDNNFTTAEKTKLLNLENYDDSSLVDELLLKANITDVDAQLTTKQNTLVAGTGIEINSITNEIKSTVAPTTDYEVLNNKPRLNNQELVGDRPLAEFGIASTEALDTKQDTLVSGENIKTINGESIVGAGTIIIEGYDDTEIKADINTLQNNKADKADTYTKTEVDNKVASVYKYKGTVETVEDLELITSPNVGDVYDVIATGDNYAWDGTIWDKLSGIVDLSSYALKTELPTNTSDLINDSDYVSDSNYVHTDNNFTTVEKDKLTSLNNYDDTVIKNDISIINTTLGAKVDKVEGKGLSTNDFTTEEKTKLETLNNYVLPSATASRLGGCKIGDGMAITPDGYISTKVIYTDEEKAKLGELSKDAIGVNFDNTELKMEATNVQDAIEELHVTFGKTFVGTQSAFALLPETEQQEYDTLIFVLE